MSQGVARVVERFPKRAQALVLILRMHRLGTPVILGLGRWRQEDQKYKLILSYVGSLRPWWDIRKISPMNIPYLEEVSHLELWKEGSHPRPNVAGLLTSHWVTGNHLIQENCHSRELLPLTQAPTQLLLQ